MSASGSLVIFMACTSGLFQGWHRPGKVFELDLVPGKQLEFEKRCLLSWKFVKIILENMN